MRADPAHAHRQDSPSSDYHARFLAPYARARRESAKGASKLWIPNSLQTFKNSATFTSDLAIARFQLPRTGIITIPLQPVMPYGDARRRSSYHRGKLDAPVWELLRADDTEPEARWEERNSYDDMTPIFPYHPVSWTGRLPGPGLMKVDELVRRVLQANT